jgi:hypothetical protein
MSTPANLTPAQRRAVIVRANAAAIADTAQVLREVACHDHFIDPRRGDVSKCQASLLDAVGMHLAELPELVVSEALAVVVAVDQATGSRRDGTARTSGPSMTA